MNFVNNNFKTITSSSLDGSMKILPKNLNHGNRILFFNKKDLDLENLISANVNHTETCKIVTNNKTKIINNVDALVTNNKNLILSVTHADCYPISFWDYKKNNFGIIHAGWRGVSGSIIENSMQKMKYLGSNISNIKVFIGPGIKKCHFKVNKDVEKKFNNFRESIRSDISDSGCFIDLLTIIKKKFINLSVNRMNIKYDKRCTFCDNNLYSHRRDNLYPVKAMISLIGFF